MKSSQFGPQPLHAGSRVAGAAFLLFCFCASHATSFTAPASQGQRSNTETPLPQDTLSRADAELRTGIELTGRGRFADAIPHFLAAEGHVADEQALQFDLALCYLGTSQFAEAMRTLDVLKSSGTDNEKVENLLAQSYIGNGQSKEAFESLQRAASFSPKDEKLYVFVADACADRRQFDLGLRVVQFGLDHLPKSARLHYERGYFLVLLDHWDQAQTEFDQASSLAPNNEIGYLAQAQKFKFAGDLPNEIRVAREAVKEGHANFLSLSLLGDALIAAGATPGQPEFEEARAALQKAVEARPQSAEAQLSLGALLLMQNQLDSAIEHLEIAKNLAPGNAAVYSRLALAYRKAGNKAAAAAALSDLAQLNAQQAETIRTAPGDRKAINAGGGAPPNTH
jgi:tetratricopeptide (TPR) repeat protein